MGSYFSRNLQAPLCNNKAIKGVNKMFSKKKRNKVKAMFEAGYGISAISEAVGISKKVTKFIIETEIMDYEVEEF